MTPIGGHRAAIAVFLSIGILVLAGCERTGSQQEGKGADASKPAASEHGSNPDAVSESAEGVTLSTEQVEKLGVVTEPAKASDYAAEVLGYGVVTAHDTIATAVAELATAQAAQDQSRAAAARVQRLAGTPGAMSADAVETATRQVATDAAALALAERRLSSVIGAPPGGLGASGTTLQALASGKAKLLRATFPLGTLQGAMPNSLRAGRLDAPTAGWTLHPIWAAPADATLPGRSFFGLLDATDAGEGERLMVRAAGTGPTQRGVLVPGAALVLSGGGYWCYVQHKPGVYVRRPVATDKPLGDGYVVTDGIAEGEAIVTAGGALLLAREMNPSTEAD